MPTPTALLEEEKEHSGSSHCHGTPRTERSVYPHVTAAAATETAAVCSPSAPAPPPAAPPVVTGDECRIVGGDYDGRIGKVVALDEDGDAYLRLVDEGRGRAVVPLSQLFRCSPPATLAAPATAQTTGAVVDDGRAGGQVETATVSAAAVEPPGDDAAMNAGAAPDEGVGMPGEACLSALRTWNDGVQAASLALLADSPSAAVTLAAELRRFVVSPATGRE